jgi:HSP20 family protein
MLSSWNPFSELMRFGETAERWPFGQYSQRFSPAVDIREEKDAIVISAELPGMKPEEVNVSVDGNLLTISGERKFEHEQKEEGYRRIERSYGSFSRSFTLPDTVAIDRLDAEMKEGVLTIRLPKTEKAQPKRIAVKSSTKPAAEVGVGQRPSQEQPQAQAAATRN